MFLWLVGHRYYNTWAPRKLNVLTSFLLPSFRFRNNCFQLDREAGRSFTILSLLSLLPTTNPLCSSAVPVAVSLYSPSDPVTPALLPANEEQIFPCCYNMGSRSNSPAKPSSPLIVRLIAVSKWGFVYFTPKDSRWSRYICCFFASPVIQSMAECSTWLGTCSCSRAPPGEQRGASGTGSGRSPAGTIWRSCTKR